MLFKCKECNKEISDKATSCPFCGVPVRAQTIELTSKKWKAAKLICLLLMLGSCSMMFDSRGNDSMASASLIFSLAFIGLIISFFGAWWEHK